jgi:glyoxylase-like metal-dependent hydrolase (beta-lactamase superfamily II)
MVWKNESVSKEYSDITPPGSGAHLHFDHARGARDSRTKNARIKIPATTVRSLKTTTNPTIQHTLPPSSFSKEKTQRRLGGYRVPILKEDF